MKRIISLILIAALVISLQATISINVEASDFSKSAADFVSNIRIGWNLGNTFDSYSDGVTAENHEMAWGNPKTTREMINKVSSTGFNAVRIPISWGPQVTESDGTYTVNAGFITRLKEVVGWCYDNEMYVIINMHHDDSNWLNISASDEDWAKIKEKYRQIWNQVATAFKDYDEKLIFEGGNEILATTEFDGCGNSSTTKCWWGHNQASFNRQNELYDIFVDTVRETNGNNERRYLMLPTYGAQWYSNQVSKLVIPNSDTHIIMDIHWYDYNSQQNASTRQSFATMWKNYADSNNCAVVIGECGFNENVSSAIKVSWAQSFVKDLKSTYNIPVFLWDDGGNMKILNRTGSPVNWTSNSLNYVNACVEATLSENLTADSYAIRSVFDANSYQGTTNTGNISSAVLTRSYNNTSSIVDSTLSGGQKVLQVSRTGVYDAQGINYASNDIADYAKNSLGFRVWVAAADDTNCKLSDNITIGFRITNGGTSTYYSTDGWYGANLLGDISTSGSWHTIMWEDMQLDSTASFNTSHNRLNPGNSSSTKVNLTSAELNNMDAIHIVFEDAGYTDAVYYLDDIQFLYDADSVQTGNGLGNIYDLEADSIVEKLGQPAYERFKNYSFADYARNIWDMTVIDGKVLLSCGDYEYNSGASTDPVSGVANAGTPIYYFTNDSKTAKNCTYLNGTDLKQGLSTECVQKFFNIDGTVYALSTDPLGEWASHYYKFNSSTAQWDFYEAAFPAGEHVYDMIEYDGKIFFADMILNLNNEDPDFSDSRKAVIGVMNVLDKSKLGTSERASKRIEFETNNPAKPIKQEVNKFSASLGYYKGYVSNYFRSYDLFIYKNELYATHFTNISQNLSVISDGDLPYDGLYKYDKTQEKFIQIQNGSKKKGISAVLRNKSNGLKHYNFEDNSLIEGSLKIGNESIYGLDDKIQAKISTDNCFIAVYNGIFKTTDMDTFEQVSLGSQYNDYVVRNAFEYNGKYYFLGSKMNEFNKSYTNTVFETDSNFSSFKKVLSFNSEAFTTSFVYNDGYMYFGTGCYYTNTSLTDKVSNPASGTVYRIKLKK